MGFSKKKKRSSFPFHVRLIYFHPKVILFSKKRNGLRFLSMSDFRILAKTARFLKFGIKKANLATCNVHGLILFTKISKKTSVTSQYPS